MLFLNNNKLSGTLDLTNFKILKIVDVQNNMIDELILPRTVVEITANNNNLKKLQIGYNQQYPIKNLKLPNTFECLIVATNKIINEFPPIKKLELYNFDRPLNNLPITLEKLMYEFCGDNIDKSRIHKGHDWFFI